MTVESNPNSGLRGKLTTGLRQLGLGNAETQRGSNLPDPAVENQEVNGDQRHPVDSDDQIVSADSEPDVLRTELEEVKTTARELAAELQRVETLNNALLASSQDFIIESDYRGEIKFVSPSAQEMGWSTEDLKGQSLEMIATEEHRQKVVQVLANYRRNTNVARLERLRKITTLGKDGAKVPCDWAITLVNSADDGPGSLVSRFRDTTELDILSEKMDRLTTAMDSYDSSIVVHSNDGTITSWNSGAIQLFGYSEQEAVGKGISMLVPEDRCAEFSELLMRIENGDEIEPFETSRLMKDGRSIGVELKIAVLRDATGRVTGVSSIFRDISKEKQLEEQLKSCQAELEARLDDTTQKLEQVEAELGQANKAAVRSVRAREEFVIKLGRECRDRLLNLTKQAEQLIGQDADATAKQFASIVKSDGDGLLRLMDDAVEFSAIETETLESQPSECSVLSVVADAISEIQPKAESRSISLEAEFQWPIPETIQTDRQRLRQVLVNILRNSIAFADGGKLRLIARVQQRDDGQHQLGIDVIDNVTGMTDARLNRLLQPFEHVDAPSGHQREDTCLGLAVSKRLSQLLGGDVVAASIRGRGRLFRVQVDAGDLTGVRMLESAEQAGFGPGLCAETSKAAC